MEPIKVNLRQRPGQDQEMEPISFIAMGHIYHIESIGRRWQGTDGTHILVMDARHQVYHLFLNQLQDQWYWVKSLDSPTAASV